MPICAAKMLTRLLQLDFPGYAIGGLAVGEPHSVTCEMAGEVAAKLPQDRPRYLMGVGKPEQIPDYVGLWRGHDGLRAAYAERAERLPVYFAGARADQECAICQGSAAAR